MKRTFVLCTLFLSLLLPCVQAQTIGDIDNDGKVGLREAINGLQAVTGIRSQSATSYDYTEYLEVPGSTLIYETTKQNAIGSLTVTVSAEVFETKPVTVIYYNGNIWPPMKLYRAVEGNNIHYLGYTMWWPDPSSPYTGTLSPYSIVGTRNMKIGERFTGVIEDIPSGSFQFRQNEFMGFGDVTVPAGTFTDCIIMLHRREKSTFYLSHYAKHIGLVKRIIVDDNGGNKWELTSANINGTEYGVNN